MGKCKSIGIGLPQRSQSNRHGVYMQRISLVFIGQEHISAYKIVSHMVSTPRHRYLGIWVYLWAN